MEIGDLPEGWRHVPRPPGINESHAVFAPIPNPSGQNDWHLIKNEKGEAMKKPAYKPRTLTGAARRVRELERIVKDIDRHLGMANAREELLAMLAATGPCFDNPIHAAKAMEIRDRILRAKGLNPDGTRIKRQSD